MGISERGMFGAGVEGSKSGRGLEGSVGAEAGARAAKRGSEV